MNKNLEKEIMLLKARNKRVELDKAWETSWLRKGLITGLTYIVMCLILYVIGIQDFYLSALIPTIGFFLSTLSLEILKKQWIKRQKDK